MDVRLQVVSAILGGMRPGRFLDLATGHGKFAVLARDLGWNVTAVDVRTEQMPFEHGIEWIESDVRQYEVGDFDCIAILGLLYHLEAADQLSLLQRCSSSVAIVDTHISLRNECTQEGYAGRLFHEELAAPTASWNNETSFWALEGELMRMMYDAGFGFVLKLHPNYRVDRSFWLCFPRVGHLPSPLADLVERADAVPPKLIPSLLAER